MLLRGLMVVAAIAGGLVAAPIGGLVNTGAGLGDGANDPSWSILSPVQAAVTISNATIPPLWIANDTSSRWIWQQADAQPANVTRTFRLSFNLSGVDLSTVTISGRWTADNNGLDILVNGVSTGNTATFFAVWSPFVLNSGFVNGTNTLDFVVQDTGFFGGFRAEFLSSNAESAVPEPAAYLLMLTGAAMLGARMMFSRLSL